MKRGLIRWVAACSLLATWVGSGEALAQSLTVVPSATTVGVGQIIDLLATIQDTAPAGDSVALTGSLGMSFGDGATSSTNFSTTFASTSSASYTFQYAYVTPGIYTAQLIAGSVTVATYTPLPGGGFTITQTSYGMLPGPSIAIDVVSVVPEPTSVALTLAGLAVVVAARRGRAGPRAS